MRQSNQLNERLPALSPQEEAALAQAMSGAALVQSQRIALILGVSLCLDPFILFALERLEVITPSPEILQGAMLAVYGVAVALTGRDLLLSLARSGQKSLKKLEVFKEKYWHYGVALIVAVTIGEAIIRSAGKGLGAIIGSLVVGAIVAVQIWRQVKEGRERAATLLVSDRDRLARMIHNQLIFEVAPSIAARLGALLAVINLAAEKYPASAWYPYGIVSGLLIAAAFPQQSDFRATCKRCAISMAAIYRLSEDRCPECRGPVETPLPRPPSEPFPKSPRSLLKRVVRRVLRRG